MCTCIKFFISNIWVLHIRQFHVSGLVLVLFGLLIRSAQSLWTLWSIQSYLKDSMKQGLKYLFFNTAQL